MSGSDSGSPGSVLATDAGPTSRREPPRLGIALIAVLAVVAILVGLTAVGDAGPGTSEGSSETGRLEWTVAAFPTASLREETLVATAGGFAMLATPEEGGTTLWSSPDGLSWSPSNMRSSPFGIVAANDDVVAFRDYRAVRLEWDGQDWVERAENELPTFARSGYQSGRPALIYSEDGVLLHSVEGELFFSPNGEDFELVVERGAWWNPDSDPWERFTAPLPADGCDPPFESSLDYPPVLATPPGFVAFVPLERSGSNLTWPVCDPQLWRSATGGAWAPVPGEASLERGSFVYDAAGRRGRYVAVGGRADGGPAVWTSDDGLAWSVVDWPGEGVPFVMTRVEAGDLGFVVLGRAGAGPQTRAWFSTDGSCWHTLPSEIHGSIAAVGDDRLVLADRRPGADLWVGVYEPGARAQCDVGAPA